MLEFSEIFEFFSGNSYFERIRMVRMVRMVRSLADRTFQLWSRRCCSSCGRSHGTPRTGRRSLRTRLNIELNFPPKLRGARSRLYRRRFLQVNTRWKALAEIYTMHSSAPFFNLKMSAKNRQNVFAIQLMNID